jgi:hypothetical protein
VACCSPLLEADLGQSSNSHTFEIFTKFARGYCPEPIGRFWPTGGLDEVAENNKTKVTIDFAFAASTIKRGTRSKVTELP